jgi:hypothetical protein
MLNSGVPNVDETMNSKISNCIRAKFKKRFIWQNSCVGNRLKPWQGKTFSVTRTSFRNKEKKHLELLISTAGELWKKKN